ncbi:hypothetical protein GCM10009530_17140 [Microbispora corallina]|uniref:CBM2 domain-containing protein n=2 Tax=Microbispora corallina TaxID=83302 RepID=A0ABQ4FXY2_9ACTN|nr:hypothetical protein Mco01_26730 [Microbispora corallina]
MTVTGIVSAALLAGAAPALGAVKAVDAVAPHAPAAVHAGIAAADVSPPSRPSGLRACPPPVPSGGTTGYVGLCWTASSDDVGVAGYDVYQLGSDGFQKVASVTSATAILSGLRPARDYTYYVVARDAAGNVSPPSSLITTVAVAGPYVSPTPIPGDTTPPSAPTGLRDYCVADLEGVSFCWNASTDDVGVARYDVYRQTDTAWTRVGTRTSTWFYEQGLVVGRSYTYVVVAEDAAGNVSAPSAPLVAVAHQGYPTASPTPTPTPTPTPSPTPTPTPTPSPTPSPSPATCAVSYGVWSWNGGFSASVTIGNTGTAPIDGWTLRFTFPDAGQRLVNGWSAAWSQSGSAVSATDLRWNAVIKPGASVLIGFNGAFTGANPSPSAFTLNGRPCTKA